MTLTTDHPQAKAQVTTRLDPPVGSSHPETKPNPTPNLHAFPGTHVVDPLLFIHATTLSDLEHQRIANQLRYAALTRTGTDADGITRGWGLPATHPDVARLGLLVDALKALEHDAEGTLKQALKRCSINPWVAAQPGIGPRQAGRLLAAIGDPYWNLTEDQPRTVSQLWAYCGLHVLPSGQGAPDNHGSNAEGSDSGDPNHAEGVAARRRKGQRANWSSEAKTRAFLVASRCIMFKGGIDAAGRNLPRSPYRDTYDQRREHTATTHPDWTPGHSHNDALRITSKAILRDLWREARRLHSEPQ